MPKKSYAMVKDAFENLPYTDPTKKKKKVPKDVFGLGNAVSLIKRRQRVNDFYSGIKSKK